MRGEFVETGGERLYYYASGERGKGDPIILLHGFPTSGHVWNNLVALLPTGHRIVVPDLVGYGRSDATERADLTLTGHAERIIGLLDELQIARGCLVGHHLGAAVGAVVASRQPGRVTHLGLLHPLAGDVTLTGTFAVMRALLPATRLTPSSVWRRPIRLELTRWFSDPVRCRASVDQYLSSWQKPARWKQLLRQMTALDVASMLHATEALATLAMPVAIVGSHDDPASPRVALDRVCEALPSATLDIVGNARHFSPEESPERVADVVERLLRT
jgi:pimeloyl-ACP methyl ester carboxylesterase